MKKIIEICDKCGIKVEKYLERPSTTAPYIHSFGSRPGYPSRFDGQMVAFDLCDNCLQLLLELYIGISIGVDESE